MFIFIKTESHKMAWPVVQTKITPSHYAYIGITLSFLFPPEISESITRLTKKCDEAQNLLDHGVLYVHTYMLNTLKNVSLSSFTGMRLTDVFPSQKTLTTKRCLTSHIWRVGTVSNNPQIAEWGAWIPDNKSVSKRMKDRITEENRWNRIARSVSINSYDYLLGGDKSIHEDNIIRHTKKDYVKIAKKERKDKIKILKLQTPKQKMKFFKNQPRYINRVL